MVDPFDTEVDGFEGLIVGPCGVSVHEIVERGTVLLHDGCVEVWGLDVDLVLARFAIVGDSFPSDSVRVHGVILSQ